MSFSRATRGRRWSHFGHFHEIGSFAEQKPLSSMASLAARRFEKRFTTSSGCCSLCANPKFLSPVQIGARILDPRTPTAKWSAALTPASVVVWGLLRGFRHARLACELRARLVQNGIMMGYPCRHAEGPSPALGRGRRQAAKTSLTASLMLQRGLPVLRRHHVLRGDAQRAAALAEARRRPPLREEPVSVPLWSRCTAYCRAFTELPPE